MVDLFIDLVALSFFKYIYIYFPFSLLCDFVCIALLLPFVLGFCLSFFLLLYFLALVIIGGFVYWLGCPLLSFF